MGDNRRSRKEIIQIIERLVRKVEGQQTYVAEWTDYLDRTRHRTTFTVEALYAFGSFARGAPTCGDLDLILEIRYQEGFMPHDSVIRSVVLGRPRNVDVLVQSVSTEFRHTDRFAESHMIWSRQAPDWRANVALIQVEDNAGHYVRKTDQLPISLKQLHVTCEGAEMIVDRIENEDLTSSWVHFDEIGLAPDSWDQAEKDIARRLGFRIGKRSGEILPHVLQYIFDRRDDPLFLRYHRQAEFQVSSCHAHLGRPAPDIALLDCADTAALILAPHKASGVSLGIWVIQRGPKHRLVNAFEDLRAWTIGIDGTPMYCMQYSSYGSITGVFSQWAVELYPTQSAVSQAIDDMSDHDDCKPLCLNGEDLLTIASKISFFNIMDKDVRVSGEGVALAKELQRQLSITSE